MFFGDCPTTGERRVIKQINLKNNPKALVKELQVFKLFIQKLDEPGQDSPPVNNTEDVEGSEAFIELQEVIRNPDMFRTIQGVPRVLGLKYTDTVAELKMDFCGDSIQTFMRKSYF